MVNIKSSTDLRNNYSEISKICHETEEPMFITKNGRGNLVIMSIDLFNKMFFGKNELYNSLEASEESVRNGKTSLLEATLTRIEEMLDNGSL